MDIATGIDPVWYEKLRALSTNAYSTFDYPNAAMGSIGGGTLPTFTATPYTSRCAQIGKLVFMSVAASNTSGGTPGAGTQQLTVSLPDAVSMASLGGLEVSGSFSNGGQQWLVLAQFTAGATTAPLYQQNVSGSKVNVVPLTCGDLNNVSRSLSLQFFYPVD